MFSHLIMGKNRGSSEGDKYAYLRISFWLNRKNWFWEVTYKDRPDKLEYYRNWLANWLASQKNVATIDPNLK